MGARSGPHHLNRATHMIYFPDLEDWLADHGADAHDVVSAAVRIEMGAKPGSHLSAEKAMIAWLDLVLYMRDTDGEQYIVGDDLARRLVSVPLRSFPPLHDPEAFDPRRESFREYHERRKGA